MASFFIYDSINMYRADNTDAEGTSNGTTFSSGSAITNHERASDQNIGTVMTNIAQNDALQYAVGSTATADVAAVYFTGLIEIVGGALLLINKYRKKGGALMIILLLLVFPANIYLVFSHEAQMVFQGTRMDALIRLPFQMPLIFIAYWHSKERVSKWVELFCILSFPPTIIYFLTL